MPLSIDEERPDGADAAALIAELDDLLARLYAHESRHGCSVEKLVRDGVRFFVARVNGEAAGCGAVLFVGPDYGEVKRMYVRPRFRGRGVGRRILEYLAEFTRAHALDVLRLETGIYQVEAIRLYESVGFQPIPPFGPYRADPVSLCYEKRLARDPRRAG